MNDKTFTSFTPKADFIRKWFFFIFHDTALNQKRTLAVAAKFIGF